MSIEQHQHGDPAFGQRRDGTLTLSFYSASAPTILQAFVEWARELDEKCHAYSPLPGKWHEFLGEYSMHDTVAILCPTRGQWCAFIDNNLLGSIPFGKLHVISERLNIGYAAFIIDDLERRSGKNDAYAAMFNYGDARWGEFVVRSVAVLRYGGQWEYSETGSPLPFEEVESYKKRKKADRLTPDMLIRYARALGIHLDEGDSFYDLSRAIGLKWESTRSQSVEEQEGIMRRIAEKINQELGVNWKFNIFRSRPE